METNAQSVSGVLQKTYESFAFLEAILLQAEKETTLVKKQKEALLEHIIFLENKIQDHLKEEDLMRKEIDTLKLTLLKESSEKVDVLQQNQLLQSEKEILQNTIQKQQEKFKESESLQKKIEGLKSFLESQLLCTLEYKRRISAEGETFERKLDILLSELEQKDPQQSACQSNSISSSTMSQKTRKRWNKIIKNLTFSCVGAGCYFLEHNFILSALLGLLLLTGWAIYKLKEAP